MPAPSTSVLDNFNRADENPLSGGGNWARAGSTVTDLRILTNVVAGTASTTSQESYTAGGSLTDCEAYCTISTLPGSANLIAAVARHLTTGNTGDNCYFASYNQGTGIQLVKIVAGTATTLGTVAITAGVGDQVAIQCVGTTISAWYKASGGSWTQEISVTDSSLSAGYLGLRVRGTTGRADDFGGGAISAGTAYTESATISGTTSLSSTELANYVESNTISGVISLSSSELSSTVESATIAGIATIFSTEKNDIDLATIKTITSIQSSDIFTHNYVESAVAESVTTPDVILEVPTTITVDAGITGSAIVGYTLTAVVSIGVSGGVIGGSGGGTPIVNPDQPGYTNTYSPEGQWGTSDDDNGVIV